MCGVARAAAPAPERAATVERHAYRLVATGPGAYELEETLAVTVYTPAAAKYFGEAVVYAGATDKVLRLDGELLEPGARRPTVARPRHRSVTAAYDGAALAHDGEVHRLRMPLPTAYPARYRITSAVRVREAVALPVIGFRYPPWAEVTAAELRIGGAAAEVRYRVVDGAGAISETTDASGERVFRVRDRPPRAREDFAAAAAVAGPCVLLAPRRGRLEGYEGDFTTWAGIGAWTAELLAERSALPPEATAEVRALVAGIVDPLERVRRVYAYVQARTHYVSIQLGIGGFQPVAPADVHRYGYGDCKALTNHTRLLLAAVGLESYYCLIGVGDREIRHPDFASLNQANHALLAVPVAADTLWLECTSQQTPANFLGASAAGRLALLIDGGTGVLVRAGDARAEDHRRARVTELRLAPDGTAAFRRETRLEGASAAAPIYLRLASPEERRERCRRDWVAVGVEFDDVRAGVAYEGTSAVGHLTEVGRLRQCGRALGRRLVLPVAGHLPPPIAPADTASRSTDVTLVDDYVLADTLRYTLPEGYAARELPPTTTLEGPQGAYRVSARGLDGGRVVEVTRALTLRGGTYPAAAAPALARFAAAVSRADRRVIVVEPKT